MENELLPEIDLEFLQEKDFNYELIQFQAGVYLIIKDYEFPPCYAPQKANLLIILPAGYPNAKVDMFFTIPDIKLLNGNFPQAAAAHPTHNKVAWQQWSRHSEWRVGVDNLRSYFAAIKTELTKGL